jgi:hypothetical protein
MQSYHLDIVRLSSLSSPLPPPAIQSTSALNQPCTRTYLVALDLLECQRRGLSRHYLSHRQPLVMDGLDGHRLEAGVTYVGACVCARVGAAAGSVLANRLAVCCCCCCDEQSVNAPVRSPCNSSSSNY